METTVAVRGLGITKVFGDVVALDHVDLNVARGRIHGLVGPNGAGKTTLLGLLLLGLAVADEGRLEILGGAVGRSLAAPGTVSGFVDGPGLALPGYAFISWNGLFTDSQQLQPLLIGIAVSLVWAVVATVLAYLLFLRRDFTDLTDDGAGRKALTLGVLPLAGVLAVSAGVVAVTTGAGGSGIGQGPEVGGHRLRAPLRAAGGRDAPAAAHRVPIADFRDLFQKRGPRRSGRVGE